MVWNYNRGHFSYLEGLYVYGDLFHVQHNLHDHLEYPDIFKVSRVTVYPLSIPSPTKRPLTHYPSRFFAWYLFGVNGCSSPIIYSTVNSIVKEDSEERALVMVGSPPFHFSLDVQILKAKLS